MYKYKYSMMIEEKKDCSLFQIKVTFTLLSTQMVKNFMMDEPLIVCVDVDYRTQGAIAAGVWFRGWQATSAEHEFAVCITEVAEYEPGAFYRRELPCLLRVLAGGPQPQIVVVDGYVFLEAGVPGLGGHLHAVIGGVVVGVAKTRFASAIAVPVCRGESSSPLFVTAVGIEADEAAECVLSMHGQYRLPTLLKRVDRLAREAYPDYNSYQED